MVKTYLFNLIRRSNTMDKTDNCDKCGNINVPWSISDEHWNLIADDISKSICPQCFVKMAKDKIDDKKFLIGFTAEIIYR